MSIFTGANATNVPDGAITEAKLAGANLWGKSSSHRNLLGNMTLLTEGTSSNTGSGAATANVTPTANDGGSKETKVIAVSAGAGAAATYSQFRYAYFICTPAQNPYVGAYLALNRTAQAGASRDFWGWIGEDTGLWSSATRYAGFKWTDPAGTLKAISKDGVTEESTTLAAYTPTTAEHFAVKMTSAAVTFYRGGVLVATHAVNIPNGTCTPGMMAINDVGGATGNTSCSFNVPLMVSE